ncbi:4-hydroxyphenylpyruvate dioxygenase [Streptomyces sp. NPDC005322]|uniref:4-hydroxyphenylpyruvate dioxygenase n=1 Tax=Streptomyces sp. NPDC005322 TaxID=3157032 RepID=UPI0033B0DA44
MSDIQKEERTMSNPFENADAAYHVLVNAEGQHSLWPTFIDVPAGWTVMLDSASRQECLDFIEKSWTDMRPKSLIEAMRADSSDFSVEYVECYVGDLDLSVANWVDNYAFKVIGEAGSPEHGFRSRVLRQNRVVIVLTQAVAADHPAKTYVDLHGDGVAKIALGTADPDVAYQRAVQAGAQPVANAEDGEGSAVRRTVIGFGDLVHTFTEKAADDAGLPVGFTPLSEPLSKPDIAAQHLEEIDHFAVCVNAGELDETVSYYCDVLGFDEIFEERIVVGTQAMLSKVVQSRSRKVTFTIIEPDTTCAPGQIDQFLAQHRGSGIQHIAFGAFDAVEAVRTLAGRGVAFLSTPGAYYDRLEERISPRKHDLGQLRELNLLVDEDHGGQLFQIFTRSVHPRRTLFFEVIERIGAETFGSANIKALYEAVEAERLKSGEAGA